MKAWAMMALLVAGGAAEAQMAVQPYRPPPANLQPKSLKEVMIPPGRRKPVVRGNQQSAVLSLLLGGGGGDARATRLNGVRVVDSAAPKVFARSAGDWEVRLIGGATTSYRIPNPLDDVEVENGPNSRSPYSQVREPGPIRFELVVPLSRDGRALGVRTIEIVDTVSGKTVLSTPVRGAR